MTTTTIYRNDTTGYTVTLIDVKPGVARVKDSNGYDFPMIDADYPHAATLAKSRAHFGGAIEVPAPAPAQMTSPLPVALQVRSSRPLATGAAGAIGEPTLPQARCLDWAKHGGIIRRGMATYAGSTATMSQLIGMMRRGWVTLDDNRRPTQGRITCTGMRALVAYVAKHGEVL